jgi:hypothetical protein
VPDREARKATADKFHAVARRLVRGISPGSVVDSNTAISQVRRICRTGESNPFLHMWSQGSVISAHEQIDEPLRHIVGALCLAGRDELLTVAVAGVLAFGVLEDVVAAAVFVVVVAAVLAVSAHLLTSIHVGASIHVRKFRPEVAAITARAPGVELVSDGRVTEAVCFSHTGAGFGTGGSPAVTTVRS